MTVDDGLPVPADRGGATTEEEIAPPVIVFLIFGRLRLRFHRWPVRTERGQRWVSLLGGKVYIFSDCQFEKAAVMCYMC